MLETSSKPSQRFTEGVPRDEDVSATEPYIKRGIRDEHGSQNPVDAMLYEENGGRKHLLLLSEIFSSVQGEGVNLGSPSVFLRLAVCNLHCWYCDTKYTWLYSEKMLQSVRAELGELGVDESEFPSDLRVYERSAEAREVPIKEVESRIRAFEIKHLVVTGGEPMLQQSQLVPLLRELKNGSGYNEKSNFYVEIETNGSIKPTEEILPFVDQWNVSPKLASSGNSTFARERKDALKSLASLPNSFFKFVVSQECFDQDLQEIESLASRYGISPRKTILMAEGTEASILKDRTASLSKVCEKRGYRITPRLQILLWGNRRGT